MQSLGHVIQLKNGKVGKCVVFLLSFSDRFRDNLEIVKYKVNLGYKEYLGITNRLLREIGQCYNKPRL